MLARLLTLTSTRAVLSCSEQFNPNRRIKSQKPNHDETARTHASSHPRPPQRPSRQQRIHLPHVRTSSSNSPAAINDDTDIGHDEIETQLNALVVASGTNKPRISGTELENLYRETYVAVYTQEMGKATGQDASLLAADAETGILPRSKSLVLTPRPTGSSV